MTSYGDVGRQVMKIVNHSPGCALEEIVLGCPGFTWNQVFLALDRLSRVGQITLKQKERGLYTITPRRDGAGAEEWRLSH